MSGITSSSQAFAWPTIALHGDKLQFLTQSCIDAHVKYGLGAKANPLTEMPGQFHKIDCSGFVRWAIFHGSGVTVPDGSAVQHEWFDAHGFKHSTTDAGLLHDGTIRIAFLSPHDSNEGIGHVLLILNGMCYESHGSTGPDNQRKWLSKPNWMPMMKVYVVNIA